MNRYRPEANDLHEMEKLIFGSTKNFSKPTNRPSEQRENYRLSVSNLIIEECTPQIEHGFSYFSLIQRNFYATKQDAERIIFYVEQAFSDFVVVSMYRKAGFGEYGGDPGYGFYFRFLDPSKANFFTKLFHNISLHIWAYS